MSRQSGVTRRLVRWFRVSWSGLLALVPLTAALAATQYLYDDLGRLVLVANADGSAIVYEHDANGNVLSINQWAASGPVIAGFSPSYGHAGTTVTILGTGFSATPAQNAVTIGGVAASVSSATATTLVSSIPQNSNTGPITVTVDGETAVSTQNITVLKPIIVSFSPALVAPGAPVTVTGAYLNRVPGSTSISVGGAAVTITSLSNIHAVFTAPNNTGGRIVISTSYGQTQSVADLSIVPAAIGAANVVAQATLEPDGPAASLAINQQNKYALLRFDAAANSFYSVQTNSLTTTPANAWVMWQMFSPAGTSIASGSFPSTAPSIHLPKTTTAGTYIVSFASGASSSVQVNAAVELNPTLTANGASVGAATTAVRQSKRVVFNATAGDDLSLALTGLALAPSSPNYVRVTITRPDGYYNIFNCYMTASPGCSTNPNNYEMINMPLTGTYTVVVEPMGASTMSFNAALTEDVTGTLSPGTPLPVNLALPGQHALLTFAATAGQAVALNLGSVATTPPGKTVLITVYQPNGNPVASTNTSTQTTMNLSNLVAGTYSVLIAPSDAATATLQATLANGVVATLLPNGSTQSFSTSQPGQYGYFTFSATAGDDLSLALTGLSLSPSSPNNVRIYITQPDGYYSSFYCYTTSSPGCVTNPSNYPLLNLSTGTYSVRIEPQGPSTMSFNLTLSQNVTGTLTPGTALPVSLTQPGRQALLTFTATAGQAMALQIGSVSTTPAGKSATITVYRPNGTQLAAGSTSSQTTLNFTPSVTGTHSVLIAPADAATGSFEATLANGVTATLVPDASTQTFSTSLPGQHAYFTFSATAGDDLSLALTGLSLSPSSPNNVRIYVTRPDGYYSSFYCYTTSSPGCVTHPGNYSLMNLPLTGTYSVRVEPQGPSTMSFNLTLSQDVTGTLTPGTPLSVSLPEPGRQALLSFTATAGQSVTLTTSSIATTPAGKSLTMYVFNPAGSQTNAPSGASSITLNLTNLSAGTYSVLLHPHDAATATAQVSIQ